jgi:FkbM family methyltransferase
VYAENTNNYVLVNTISLDKYFEKQSVLPDIVKIDVQGAEYKCLKV